jgi:HPt (histidine-containing phosphotransfer) domain-containing protein
MARRDITGAVDFSHLESFAAGDQALIDEVLAMFQEQASLWVRLLDPNGPDNSWRDGAHTLKGSSLGVGAFALAQACDEAEIGCDLDPGRKTVLLDRVRDALDAALADIAAYAHERVLQSLKTR